MTRKPNLLNITVIALMATMVLLAGCGDAATATTAPQATAVAAAPTSASATTAASASTTSAATTSAATTSAATTSAATTSATTAAGTANTTAAASGASTATCTKLNLNSLNEQQLTTTIPSFPNRMVREFLEYRPYSSILQFRKEIGKYVDATQVTEWEKYVFVPIDPNKSDAETLRQLPGLDATNATALSAGRPYASTAAFLQALGTKVNAQQLASASCYLGA